MFEGAQSVLKQSYGLFMVPPQKEEKKRVELQRIGSHKEGREVKVETSSAWINRIVTTWENYCMKNYFINKFFNIDFVVIQT